MRLADETARGFKLDEHGEWWHHFSDGRRIRGHYVPCVACKSEFMIWRARKKVYCSTQCESARYTNALKTRKCRACNREFISRKLQKFCSHTCAATTMHLRRKRTTTKRDIAVLNADNPRYSQDPHGQWWYSPGGKPHTRTRASIKECEHCGKRFLTNMNHRIAQRFCSRTCGILGVKHVGLKGPAATNWKGGRRVDHRGYVLIWCPDHPARANTSIVSSWRSGWGAICWQLRPYITRTAIARITTTAIWNCGPTRNPSGSASRTS
jgi:hypothetical protein